MIYTSQEELDAALAYWQKVLRLQDWTVSATINRSRDMGDTNRGGEIRINDNRKGARIQLLDPVDYAPTCWEPLDMEYFLVHELCHLHTTLIRPDDEETLASVEEEQAVDALAWALVGLNRK